jgi:hypothetical protein
MGIYHKLLVLHGGIPYRLHTQCFRFNSLVMHNRFLSCCACWGDTDSLKCYALMMRARNAHDVDHVVILDDGASRTYLSIFEWLTNPTPCNGTVTSVNGVKSRTTYIGSLDKLPTFLFSSDMAFNPLPQRDLKKSQLEFHYKQGVCTIYRLDISKPIMQIMVSEDGLHKCHMLMQNIYAIT